LLYGNKIILEGETIYMLFIDEVLAEDPDCQILNGLYLRDAIVYKLIDFDSILTAKDISILNKVDTYMEKKSLTHDEYEILKEAPRDSLEEFEKFFRKVHEKVIKKYPKKRAQKAMEKIKEGFVELCIEKPPSRQPFQFVVISGKDSLIVSFEDKNYESEELISRIVQEYKRNDGPPELINGQLKKKCYTNDNLLIYLIKPEEQIMVDSIYHSVNQVFRLRAKEDGISEELADEMLKEGASDEEVIQKIHLLIKTNRLFSLLTCSNIRTENVQDKLTKKQKKQGKKEPIEYKTIKVEIGKGKNSKIFPIGETKSGSHRAHQVPGRYRDYTKNPLFGKYYGIFWVPPHFKGNRELGEIKNSYEII